MRQLADTLSAERQRLPIDVPAADRATLGGVVATNTNGPRRFGQGAVRDHVIGIRAVDGRGILFQGGGRVVKNVAGYDFCKLLTGSLGTLGIVTQLTLKLKPVPDGLQFLACDVDDWDNAERLLAALNHSQTTPVTIGVVSGPAWSRDQAVAETSSANSPRLAVGLEGTAAEVQWMAEQLRREWQQLGVRSIRAVTGPEAYGLMERLAEFPGQPAPLVLEGSVVPSRTTQLAAAARDVDPACSLLAYPGNGKLIMQFAEFPSSGLARTLIARLQPVASAGCGNIVTLCNPAASEATHQSTWGGTETPFWLMQRVKQQFDPANILNPGRFFGDLRLET
jgi:glycolate oxidase FAD binding subunit